MNEIWRDPRGQGTTDLTANAQAPAAQGNPFTYFDPAGNQVVLVFRGADGHVRTLYWMFGAAGHDNLTGSINAPRTSGVRQAGSRRTMAFTMSSIALPIGIFMNCGGRDKAGSGTAT
jgi:hypothetical protein